LLTPGTYTLTVHHSDFPVDTISNVVVMENQMTVLNIVLGEFIPATPTTAGRSTVSMLFTW